MTERKIIFSAPMVRAILAGKKTQTRRILKPSAYMRRYSAGQLSEIQLLDAAAHAARVDLGQGLASPYGVPGDTLWVRETHEIRCVEITWRVRYADGSERDMDLGPDPWTDDRWGEWVKRPSIYMRRAACRIVLRVTDVRVERLQEISEQDARSEGIERRTENWSVETYRRSFELGWDAINGKRAPWTSNPWVWVVVFKRVVQEAPRG